MCTVERKIVKDGIIPEALILSATSYLPACNGIKPPKDIFCHVVGTDLVRDRDGQFYVLEDNLRCPSGVSYVLENRQVMKRTFPQVFDQLRVRPVDIYPSKLLETLQHVSPTDQPTVVVLSPGIYNSAYFEHSFLAQQMGVELVEGRDLVVKRRPRLHAHDARLPEASTSSIAGSTTCSSTRRPFAKTRSSACRGSWRSIARARSRSRTRLATASPTTRSSTRTCRR